MARKILAVLLAMSLLAGALIFSKVQIEPLKISGFIEADEVRLGSRLGGRIAEIHVIEGQQVEPGDLLISLDEYDFQQRLLGAKAELAAKSAQLSKLTNGSRPEEIAQAQARKNALAALLAKLIEGPREEERAASRAQLALANAQLDRAKRSFDRLDQLARRGDGTVSRDELDRATEEYKVATAMQEARREELLLVEKGTREEDITAARAQLEEAQQSLQMAQKGFRTEDIDQAKAAVDASRANLESLQIQHGELTIKAGISGVVSALDLRPGDLVAPNAPVISLIDTSRLWVRAYVPENRLYLQLKQQYPVSVDSYPDKRFPGEVVFLSPQAEFTPRNVQTPEERSKQVYRVKIMIIDDNKLLHPGMAADVWLEEPILAASPISGGHMLPTSSIHADSTKPGESH